MLYGPLLVDVLADGNRRERELLLKDIGAPVVRKPCEASVGAPKLPVRMSPPLRSKPDNGNDIEGRSPRTNQSKNAVTRSPPALRPSSYGAVARCDLPDCAKPLARGRSCSLSPRSMKLLPPYRKSNGIKEGGCRDDDESPTNANNNSGNPFLSKKRARSVSFSTYASMATFGASDDEDEDEHDKESDCRRDIRTHAENTLATRFQKIESTDIAVHIRDDSAPNSVKPLNLAQVGLFVTFFALLPFLGLHFFLTLLRHLEEREHAGVGLVLDDDAPVGIVGTDEIITEQWHAGLRGSDVDVLSSSVP